jgi:Delta6-protoilludene synthase
MSNLPQFYLPDPLAQWPWPRMLSDHYTEVKPESDAWLQSFEALDAKSQRSFDLCNFREPHLFFVTSGKLKGPVALLGSLVYPLLDKGLCVNTYHQLGSSYVYEFADGVRVAYDLMVLFFIYDEFTDKV